MYIPDGSSPENVTKVLDPLFHYWLGEFCRRSEDVVEEAKRQYAQLGRGVFYSIVPFQCSSQNSTHDLQCTYMTRSSMATTEYLPGLFMVANYDPTCEAVVILSVTINRNEHDHDAVNAFFSGMSLATDTHIQVARDPGLLPGPCGSSSLAHRPRRFLVALPNTPRRFMLTCAAPPVHGTGTQVPITSGPVDPAKGPKQCHFCSKTGSSGPDGVVVLQKCSRCRAAYYCSSECQRADYPAHRSFCRQFEGIKMQARAVLRAHPKKGV